MTQDDGKPRGLSEHARQHLRDWRPGSAAEFAAKVQSLGLPMTRALVANLENARRQELTVQELAAFAVALGVSPVDLVAPSDENEMVEVTPGRSYASGWVRAWWRGDGPLPEGDTEEEFQAAREAFFAHAPARVRRRNRVGMHPLLMELSVLTGAVQEAMEPREGNAAAHPRAHAEYMVGLADRVARYTRLLAEDLEDKAGGQRG